MNEFISQFHFLRPWFFLALLPAIIMTLALLKQQYQAVQWQSFIAPHLLNYLVDGEANKVKRLPLFALLAIWCLSTLALAGPVWKKLPQPVHKEASALVIIWDLSPSMKATDLSPSRVVRSRLKLFDLLNSRKEGVTALIAYSGEAHIVTPLTDDTETISSLLSGLHPDIMPVNGSNAEMALETAIQLLNDGGILRGDILFLTDGIAEEAHSDLENMLKNSGHRVVVWGVGTAEGAPIPGKNSGFLKNRQGDIIIAKLNEQTLSDAAAAMGGVYLPFTNSDFDLKGFKSLTSHTLSQVKRESKRTFDAWYEHGPYLLVLVLPFAALAFRRGWLLSVFCLATFFPAEQSQALSWEELWLNKDQQAYKDLQKGDAEQAAEKFDDKQWKGIADYKSQNYKQALENFSTEENAEALFNQGNALTHMSNYQEAKAAYNRALELNPEFQAAKDNLDIVEQLEKLQQDSQQDQQNQNQDQDQDQNQENSSQQNNQQNQQSDSSENGDQQNQQGDSSQNSEQQNSGEQDQQQANNEENEEQQNDAEQSAKQNQQASEEQQQALENQYGNQQQEEEQQQGEQSEEQEKHAQQESQLAEQQQVEQAEQEQGQNVAAVLPEERSEEDQALDQWLRKVPDDPSGLLRNKFKYESRERQLQLRNNSLRRPTLSEDRL